MNQINASTGRKIFFPPPLFNLVIETNEEYNLLLKAAVDFVYQT